MSRSTSFIGLNSRARKIVNGEKVLSHTVKGWRYYPNGAKEQFEEEVFGRDVIAESYDTYVGLCYEEYPLHKYKFPKKPTLFEYVQEAPWASGPIVFLALMDCSGKVIEESLWMEDEMELYI